MKGCGAVIGHGVICGQGALCIKCNPINVKRFHHGGRIGDCIYALYTAYHLHGGEFYLSLYHSPGWDEQMLKSLLPFIEYQSYITKVGMCDPPPRFGGIEITHDLHQAECDFNPEEFPEWKRPPWPGNANIRKRYAVHFGVEFIPDSTWLDAPQTKDIDIAFHMPERRSVRSLDSWISLLLSLKRNYGLKVKILAGSNDAHEFRSLTQHLDVIVPGDFLETADYINSATVFIGGASSCNTVAEGLGKWRLIEIAPDCFDIYADGSKGFTVNGWNLNEIAWLVLQLIEKEK